VTEESEVLDAEEVEEVVEEEEENPLIPSAFEVQNLLMQVCDETSNISEVQMKVGSFSLRVRREIGKPAPTPKPVAAGPPVLGKAMVESIPAEAVPAASKPTSTKLAKKALSGSSLKPVSNFGLIEAAADAGLLFITSPKVGLFRKGRTVKGKSGPPLCEEGQIVKEGQVVCYLEQLGTQQPVEADVTGEVEKVLWEDGVPVGYGDPLIAVKPSFPGIKVKGQLLG
jgi:biotin carboxyl carrier protein